MRHGLQFCLTFFPDSCYCDGIAHVIDGVLLHVAIAPTDINSDLLELETSFVILPTVHIRLATARPTIYSRRLRFSMVGGVRSTACSGFPI